MIEIRTDADARPARLDGGHHPAQTIAIADGIAEAVRLLNYATDPGKHGLRYPAEVYSVLGSLTSALGMLPQALTQISQFIGHGVADRRITENPHYGSHGGDAHAAHTEMHDAITAAIGRLGTALTSLQTAHSALSGLEAAEPPRRRTSLN
ncbi:hypothetical protein [Actinomadura gamaensis]|uniref:Uncharacterized protein n=1 Tax=Actinomadura gamaensis TaxID=1763541 RepID=A0ABV9U502_9ACTN